MKTFCDHGGAVVCAPKRQGVLRQEESIGIGQVSDGNSQTAVPFLVIQDVPESKVLSSSI